MVWTQFGGHSKPVDRHWLAHTRTKNAQFSDSARNNYEQIMGHCHLLPISGIILFANQLCAKILRYHRIYRLSQSLQHEDAVAVPWAPPMDRLREIFAVRKRIDRAHQPQYATDLESLENRAEAQEPYHPYSPANIGLNQVPAYQSTCRGLAAVTREYRFAYRLTSFSDALRKVAKPHYRNQTADENWQELFHDYQERKDWVPLARYATEQLPGWRNFHWWSPLDLSQGNILQNGHSVGKPSNWILRESVILRLHLARLPQNGAVPTVIDGFDSVVFRAVDYSTSPPMGSSIDLRDLNHLRPGAAEFVTENLSVTWLDCMPVLIDRDHREQFEVDTRDLHVQERLLEYYSQYERHLT